MAATPILPPTWPITTTSSARGFKHLINVFGADHAGYLTRVKAAVAALSDGKVDLDIKVCQLVKLFAPASRCACPSAPAPS